MGHHVFVIARVKARGASHATYRCIAGYYHHYCDGDEALTAALRFLNVAKQPDNADVIREEIRALDSAPDEDPECPAMPCSFLSTVVASSWDAIDDDGHMVVDGTWFSEKVVPVDAEVWDRSIGGGISVIDVTDIEHPHCSFFARSSNKPRTPLSFLQKYYPNEVGPHPKPIVSTIHGTFAYSYSSLMPLSPPPTVEQLTAKRAARRAQLLDVVDRFRDIPPLTGEMLAQAWPETFSLVTCVDSLDENDGSDGSSESEESQVEDGGSAHGAVDESIEPHNPEPTERMLSEAIDIPSLVDLTLRDAVKQAVDNSNIGQLEYLLWLPERLDILNEALHEYSAFPDTALLLLSKLVQGRKRNNATSIDLSGFNITDSQLETILPDLDGVRTLNLSRNPSITTVGLELVLERLPQLRRLLIMSCPGIIPREFGTLWITKKKLLAKLDALYWEHYLESLRFPPELSLVSTVPFNMETPVTNIVTASPAVVVQTLTTLWKLFGSFCIQRGRAYEVVWTLPMTSDQTWDERGVLRSFLAEPWWMLPVEYSSWIVIINPLGFSPEHPREWGFFPYSIVRREVAKPEKEEGPQEGDKTDEEGTKEGDEGSPEYKLMISVGEAHSLQEYLRKSVEEEGKVPASEEAVEQLVSLTNRLGVQLMGRDKLMTTVFNRR